MASAALRTLRIGTRTSPLAHWQTARIAEALAGSSPGVVCTEVPVVTEGDRLLHRPLPEIGGKGVFTEALEQALRRGEIDIAVHSLKDLPVEQPADLCLEAICFRADPRDVLVALRPVTLATLPQGAGVGTSSTRRTAQLRLARPDLQVLPLRGNVDTRIRKAQAGEYDAIILAAAGVLRLGLEEAVVQFLEFDEMLPAPGQGALAVQCRKDDLATRALLAVLDDREVRACVEAERQFLAGMGGGCSAPVAALAEIDPADRGVVRLRACVIAPDGSRVVRVNETGSITDSRALGIRAARIAAGAGGRELLG